MSIKDDVALVWEQSVDQFSGTFQSFASRVTKSDRTRATIQNAALEFVWSRPFREMNVQSLMATTNLSRASFYQYFDDIHQLMRGLLDTLEQEIFVSVAPWIEGVGDPVLLTKEALVGLTRACYERGPFLQAISDAARTDGQFERDWSQFLRAFDDAGFARVEADQAQGLIAEFDSRHVIAALNRLNASTLIAEFGKRPRGNPELVQDALSRVWISTLYGAEWVENGSSSLVRKPVQ